MSDLRASLPTQTDGGASDKETPNGPLGIKELKKRFDDSRFLTLDARTDSELSRDYYDGYQLTPNEITALAARNQPKVVNNRIQRAIDGIMGVVDQGKSDPRALMRNPPEDAPPQQQQPQMGQPQPGQQVMGGNGGPPLEDAGDIASKALRFIADTTHFDAIQMDALENGLIEGCGAAIVEVSGTDVFVTQIRWEEFFYDPYSRAPDFKDARYMGVAKWMYSDDVAALYPKAKTDMDAFASNGVLGGLPDVTWEDRPNQGVPWVDGTRKRVMVVEIYHRTAAVWYRCVFYANQILEYGVSPYQDDKSNPTCPIEGWSAYVDRNNNRYGLVKSMRDLQDEINKRRSKAMHEVNTRQLQYKSMDVPPVDPATAKREAASPDGMIPFGLEIVPRSDVVANNMEMLAEAKSEIERMAPVPALLGRSAGADSSGRAQQVRQQAGMTELSRVLGRHRAWKMRMYDQMWSRARQYWTGPKWVRVTNDNDAPEYIRINEPGPAVQGIHPQTGMPTVLPGPPKNDIAKMDVDIVLEDVPDTATLEQEIFAELSQLAQVYGPQAVPFEIILEASSLPDKRQLIEKLKAYQAQNAPQQQAAQQLTMAEGQAKVTKMQADAAKAGAGAQETQANIVLKQAQAGFAEVQTVNAALEGHIKASAAAALPEGFTLDGQGQHVPLQAPPPAPMAPPAGA